MDIKKYLNEKKEVVDSFFHLYFKDLQGPPILREAMAYSLFAGGKRMRPILAIASCEACGGDPEEIVPYASTLELIHTYSLIHDDLPSMDNDDLRRGKPTNHRVYGEAISILTGDALLTEAFRILANTAPGCKMDAASLLQAIQLIADASGCNGMVAGQVQDILSENIPADRETLDFIHMHKTAALIRASVKLGFILSGGDDDKDAALTSYGNNIGLAFQVTDDILDIKGETEHLGKKVGSDEKINKMTFPRLYGIEKSREIAEQLVSDAVASLGVFSTEADTLREIAMYLLNRRN